MTSTRADRSTRLRFFARYRVQSGTCILRLGAGRGNAIRDVLSTGFFPPLHSTSEVVVLSFEKFFISLICKPEEEIEGGVRVVLKILQ